jgi:glycosyltransferase 2 family protein
VRAADRVLPHAVAHRLAGWASTFSAGFAATRRPRELAIAVAWSFPIWLGFSAETWAVSRAFDIEVPALGVFLLQALLVLGVAVPTPGGVGSFHAAYKFGATSFFGAGEEAAVAAAIVLHAISFVPISIAGLILMAREGLTMGRLREMAGEAKEGEA